MTVRRSAAGLASALVVLSLAACGGEVAASRLTIPPDPYVKAQASGSTIQKVTTTTATPKQKHNAFAVPAAPTTVPDPGTLAEPTAAEVAPATASAADQASTDTAPADTAPAGATPADTIDAASTTATTADPAPPGPALGDSLVAICDTASENALHAACVAEISVRSTPPSLTDLSCFVRIYRLDHADLVDDWTAHIDAPTYQRVLSDIRTSCGLA